MLFYTWGEVLIMNPFSFLQSDMSKRPNTHFGHIQTEHTVQVPGTRLLYHTDSTASRIQTFPLRLGTRGVARESKRQGGVAPDAKQKGKAANKPARKFQGGPPACEDPASLGPPQTGHPQRIHQEARGAMTGHPQAAASPDGPRGGMIGHL